MEAINYLCEFFFDDFWHWLGLVVILAIVFGYSLFSMNVEKKKESKL